jgi:hypothetical protein
MAATADELTLIRFAIGDTAETVFTDAELQLLWTDVAGDFSESTQRKIIRLQVVVDAIETLMVDAAKQVNYRANQASENLSDIYNHLKDLHARHQAKLAEAKAQEMSSVRVGVMRKVPLRVKERPDA